jgi:hypothetical protein
MYHTGPDETTLATRVAELERQLAQSKTKTTPKAQRRTPLIMIVAVIASFVGAVFVYAHMADSTGAPLLQFMDYSTPHVSPPPLDTMVRWQRRDPVGMPTGHTNEILSLVAEADQKNSYTWPLYIQLAGTTDPTADQNSSQSVGATVRAFNRSLGTPWIAGYHSEVFHGAASVTGSALDAKGTSLLFNGELITKSSSGTTIGLNLQNTASSTTGGTHAINIQSGSATAVWQNGIHFEAVGNVAGNIGVNFDAARYNLGIDLADNSMRLNAGQKIYLDKFNQVYLWYNPQAARIQMVRSGLVVGSW